MVLPFVLLSISIQPEIISCLSIIFSTKSCFQGIYKGSGYDAIVNSIGVLFIHDLDEQLFIAVEKMNSSRLKQCIAPCCKRCVCCNNFCALFCPLFFVIVVGGMGQVVSEIAYANTDAPEISETAGTTAAPADDYSSYSY